MANTIDSKTDGEILASIIDGTIEELEDDMITTLQDFSLAYLYDDDGVRHLKKLYLPNVTTVGANVLRGSIGSTVHITNLDGSIFPKLQNGSNDAFNSLGVVRVNLPSWTGGTSTSSSVANRFRNMPSIKTLVLPNVINICQYDVNAQSNRTTLKAVCLGYNNEYTGTKTICANAFGLNNDFNTLVLYGEKLWTLANINALNDRTCFKSNGTGGTIYVPQSMINTYTSATNWSTIIGYTNNQILPIEGSPYEHYYCDGTPIGLSNTVGLIGFYDVGDINRYETIENVGESHVKSTVDSDLIAYTTSNCNPSDDWSGRSIPTSFYDDTFCKKGISVYSPNKKFLSDNDVIVFEFVSTENSSNNYVYTLVRGTNKSSISQSKVRDLPLDDNIKASGNIAKRNFVLRTIFIYKDGRIKIYFNGVLKFNRTVDASTVTNLNHFTFGNNGAIEDCYNGGLAIWNRELSQDEITEHYNWYVSRYHVGETAFDSSGNFIAT